jgi:hypothetical protein
MPWAEENFPVKTDAIGNLPIPLLYKVLASLRYLSRGMHWDDLAELCGCAPGGESLRVFFHNFSRRFVEHFEPIWLKPPETEEEILEAMAPYISAGLDGCFCSTDCVHIRWDRCHYSHLNQHRGKEKYPTISYSVTAAHSGYIFYCSREERRAI